MFYEEKVINGVLMWRGVPNGEWRPVTAETMTERLMRAEAFVRHQHAERPEVVALWSIRHVDGRWRTMDTIGMPDWTDDANKALAFRLREHADTFATDDPDDVRIVPWSAT